MRIKLSIPGKVALCLGLLLAVGAAGAAAAATCGTQCGRGCPNPTTCYPQSTRSNPLCSSSAPYETTCAQIAGNQLSTCGHECPAGYYPTALRPDHFGCEIGYGAERTDCRLVSGDFFSSCGITCPDDRYYVDALREDSFNCPNQFLNSRVSCRLVQGASFSKCGLTCPTGYYVDALKEDRFNCPNQFLNNRVSCRLVQGASFSTCGLTCPDDRYYVDALREDSFNCPNDFKNNRVTCRLKDESFSQCGDSCPTGYYVTALREDSTNCPNQFLNSRVDCRLVNGPTLVTCGSSCPPDYSLVGINFDPDCKGKYNLQASTCKSNQGAQGPSIVDQPKSVTICAGQTATLSVTAQSGQGQDPLTYQWYTGPSPDKTHPIPGATGPSLQVSPTTTTDYWVLVSNRQGQVASATARVTVHQPPAITAEPQPATIEVGQTATLKVTATGTSPSYHWYEGQVGDTSHPVPGGTGPSVAVSPRATASYWVRVANGCGSVDSSSVTVTVTCRAPSIVSPPQSVTLAPGQSATLTVTAAGTSPLSYQWYEGQAGDTSHPVADGTSPSIMVTPSSTTRYWVRVTNPCGVSDSIAATVTVCYPPALQVQPQSVTVEPGDHASLSVVSDGTAFQWYRGASGDTSNPLAETLSVLVISVPSTTPTSTASYWVRVFNACGAATDSSTATVTVNCRAPSIESQPQSVTINPGASATLALNASGSSLSYQWYEGQVGVTSNPVQNGTLSAVQVTPSSTTSYWVRVSSGCGGGFVNSALATVTVADCSTAPDGTSCGGDGNHTCQGGQCVCSNCASGVCCGASGNTLCDGQVHFDPNTGYTGVCASSLAGCSAASDFDGSNAVYHAGDILACVKFNGTYQWYPRRPSPRCQEVSPLCGFVCSTHYNNGGRFMCDQDGVWNQSPPLPYCYDGTIPDGWSCQTPPVCEAPQITSQPQSVTVTAGQPATLAVGATSTSTLSYQWYEGPVNDTSRPIPGGTGAAVVVAPSETTSYWVLVANGCGSASSAPATVTVSPLCDPTAITTQPQSVTIAAGQSANLSVTASGTAPSFQWYEGSSGDTSNPVPGGFGSTLVVAPPSTASYWVRVFNACSQDDSATATVTVVPANSCAGAADGTPCGGDDNHTCQGGQCVCSNCGSAVCCGAGGNTFCDGQPYFDPNTGYTGTCTASLPGCSADNDFDGSSVYHEGDILACVKYNGTYQWFPRRPSPRCQEVAPVCGFVCSTHYNNGSGFMCDQDGVWNQSPPLPYCYDGTIPDGWSCQ